MTVNELITEMGHAGAYNGGSLFGAVELYEKMLSDPDMTKFFGLSGAMVPAGMGGVVSTLMEKGHIDVLTSTGANLTHDIIEAIENGVIEGKEHLDAMREYRKQYGVE